MKTTNLKLIKLLPTAFMSIFLAIPVFAAEIEDYGSWAQTIDGSTWIKYESDYSDNSKILESKISHSKSGSQRIYFSDYYLESFDICKYETNVPSSTTMIFNGQAVKMSRWCKKFGNKDKYYFSYTPETDRGHSYVVNLFKVATSPIEIQLDNEILYLPVIGFTKAWNSAGGNAI